MIQRWLSHYHPRYVRSLVYMLQASEYGIRDYLRWYDRVRDFRHVEHRKHLIKTPKATAILALAWMILLVFYAVGIVALWVYSEPFKYIFFAGILLGTPYVLGYAIIIPLVLLTILQWPVERAIIAKARRKLDRHKAVNIAIAGSFGKTSMREILKTVLAEGKRVAAPTHSYNTPLGISEFVKTLTGDEEILLFELGEYYPGDIKKLCDLVRPQWGIITGVNEAHLEKFGSLDSTAATIFELAESLDDHPLYINGESALALKRTLPHHIVYSRAGAGNWKVEDAHTDISGTGFTIVNGEHRIRAASKLLGLHQVGPIAAATDVASRLGLSPDQIGAGIRALRPFEHRLEPKDDGSGVITLDDSYNGNPDGVKAVIEFLASLTHHRRFYVTPGLVEMGSRTEAVHKNIGRMLAKAGIEKVVLIKNSVTPFIAQGLTEAGYGGETLWFDSGPAALAALPHMTVQGDVVLLQNDWPDQYQ